MGTILFIPYFLESHILPTLGMKDLLIREHRVVYALPAKFQWFAELHGLEYVNFESVPFGAGFEAVLKTKDGKNPGHAQILHDRKTARIAKHREQKLKDVIARVKPDFFVLDMMSSTDFILIYDYIIAQKAGVAIHNPMLSTYFRFTIPHLGSSLKPVPTFRVIAQNCLVKALYGLFNLKENIIYRGHSNKNMIKKEFRRRNIPATFKLSRKSQFANFFENIPELISAPEELEFYQGMAQPSQYYTGLFPVHQRADASITPAMLELLQELKEWKQTPGHKLIFCAFGSMNEQSNPKVSSFLQKLFAARLPPNSKLVCAYNDPDNFFTPERVPAGIRIKKRVPQPDILKYADLFITHAGLGSIKESIHAAVPMLAYPFTKSWDSTGNAKKVEFHKLGLSGNIRHDSPAIIEEKINTIISTPTFHKNVLHFRDHINQKYNAEILLNLFHPL